jgi:phosphate-selective porin OprO/OprP
VRRERGIRIERNDGLFRIKLGGRFMYDVAWIHGGKEISSSFKTGFFNEARRGFGELTGTYGKRVVYKLQVDLEGESARGDGRNRYFRQAYVGVTAPDSLRGFWLGVMKEPFTMEDNTSSLNIMFMERALPVRAFAPSNNLGVMLNNETRDLNVAWRGGIFRYSGNGAGRDRVDLVGRVSAVPWSRDKDSKLLHVGASFVHQFRDDFGLRYRSRPETQVGDHFVDTGKFDVDGVDLLGLELAGLDGPLTFQSEVVLSYVNRSSGSNVQFWGTYAQVSYFLTGEQRPYRRSQGLFGRVRLKTRFDWTRRTWGAWEIAARYSYLDLEDDDILGGRLNDVTLGLNWYVYPTVRIMANFVRAHIAGDGTSNLFEMRLQIDF